jgi:hypothetical protein
LRNNEAKSELFIFLPGDELTVFTFSEAATGFATEELVQELNQGSIRRGKSERKKKREGECGRKIKLEMDQSKRNKRHGAKVSLHGQLVDEG